tara:strand:+ start:39 stop:476 length:438 start_codon:yes stop_codon:yes gene_type:complete
MAITTFSGPLRAGNNRANIGYAVMTQQYVADLSGGALAAVNTDIVIPANSKIVNILVDLEVAANATTNISVGQEGGGAATFLNTLATGTTVGLKTVTTQGGGTLEWKDIGSSDLRLTVTASAATTAGSAVITVMYAQAFNAVVLP